MRQINIWADVPISRKYSCFIYNMTGYNCNQFKLEIMKSKTNQLYRSTRENENISSTRNDFPSLFQLTISVREKDMAVHSKEHFWFQNLVNNCNYMVKRLSLLMQFTLVGGATMHVHIYGEKDLLPHVYLL